MMVDRKATQQLLEAWGEGLNLEAALKLFDPDLDKAELVQKARKQRELSAIGKRRLRDAGVNGDELFSAFDRAQLQMAAATQARESRIRRLIQALERGELIALGFSADRPKALAPEPVPNFLIDARYANFGKSEFSDTKNRYTKIRIVTPTIVPKRKMGRPSPRDAILRIASILADQRTISTAMSKTAQAAEIHKYGKLHGVAGFTERHPDKQTIIRALNSFWNLN